MRKLVWAAIGIMLLAMLVGTLSSKHGKSPALVWLERHELIRAVRPSIFTRLKFKLLRLPGPFWRWYMSRHEKILIEAGLLSPNTTATKRAELSSQGWTNQEGTRAWLLSPEELKELRSELNDGSLVNSWRMTTFDGGQTELSEGAPLSAATNSAFVGMTLDLSPEVAEASIKLTLVMTLTGTNAQPNTAPGVTTNLAVACRVQLANGGAVLLNGGVSKPSRRTNDWVIVSAVAVDAQGRPRSLGRKK